jgi:hypothetical protein
MRERKPYPNISDEELDRRAEEALKRMLANPQRQPGQQPSNGNHGNPNSNNNNSNNNNNKRRRGRRPK